MPTIQLLRAAIIGLIGFLCTGCLEAGPLNYFDNSVFGGSRLRADVVENGVVVYEGSNHNQRDR